MKQTWIPSKEKFVSAWINKCQHFGISSISRLEASHGLIKKNIKNRNKELGYTFNQIEKFCSDEFEKLRGNTDHDRFCVPPLADEPLFSQLRNQISIFCFKKLTLEYNKMKCANELQVMNGLESSNTSQLLSNGGPIGCDCEVRTAYGIPCPHVMKSFIREGKCFSVEDISSQWKLPPKGMLRSPHNSSKRYEKVNLLSDLTKVVFKMGETEELEVEILRDTVQKFAHNRPEYGTFIKNFQLRERPSRASQRGTHIGEETRKENPRSCQSIPSNDGFDKQTDNEINGNGIDDEIVDVFTTNDVKTSTGKKRRKTEEAKMQNQKEKHVCSNCGKNGHSVRSCPEK